VRTCGVESTARAGVNDDDYGDDGDDGDDG
jgi:hypothetical protein